MECHDERRLHEEQPCPTLAAVSGDIRKGRVRDYLSNEEEEKEKRKKEEEQEKTREGSSETKAQVRIGCS